MDLENWVEKSNHDHEGSISERKSSKLRSVHDDSCVKNFVMH